LHYCAALPQALRALVCGLPRGARFFYDSHIVRRLCGQQAWNPRILALLLLITFSTPSFAADVTAASGSYAAVQSAVKTVTGAGGGTVRIPACAETDWGSNQLFIDTDVPLRILGGGKDVTRLSCAHRTMFKIYGNGLTEIGGFPVDLKGTGDLVIALEEPEKTTPTLIHDIKALNSDTAPFSICQSAYQPVVMYNLDMMFGRYGFCRFTAVAAVLGSGAHGFGHTAWG